MTKYTLKKAIEITGKSESTIKRLLASIKNDSDSPDRKHISPSVEEYNDLKKSGTPFQWEFSETLLQQRFPDAFNVKASKKGTANNTEQPPSDDPRYIALLEKQINRLEETNDQLRGENSTLTTSLTSLTDRVTNMLGHYQANTLGGFDGKGEPLPTSKQGHPTAMTVVDVNEPTGATQEEGTDTQSSPTPKKSTKRKASQKKKPPKKVSSFEKHTPTFHKAFSVFRRNS